MRNFQEDVRKARRKTQDNAFCRFDTDPAEFTVYELSAHGFSFLCPKETCFFKKEAMLEKISIFNAEKLEIIRASGRVMHVAEFDFQKMRVGVFYTKKTLDRTISGKVRVPRKTPKIPLNAIMKVKVKGAEQDIPARSWISPLPLRVSDSTAKDPMTLRSAMR